VHAFGATVRLETGDVAGVPAEDVNRNRHAYERAYLTRKSMRFVVVSDSRRMAAVLAPQLYDAEFEMQIADFLKQTGDWDGVDRAPAHERHFLRKKRRAAIFESKHSNDR